MNKEFVPYQESLELKELGFDEPCIAYWYNETPTNPEGQCLVYYKKPWDDKKIIKGIIREYYYAPLYQQAFRWFREKYGMGHQITYAGVKGRYNAFTDDWVYDSNGELKEFSYEEAELACLKKLIQVVKEKL